MRDFGGPSLSSLLILRSNATFIAASVFFFLFQCLTLAVAIVDAPWSAPAMLSLKAALLLGVWLAVPTSTVLVVLQTVSHCKTRRASGAWPALATSLLGFLLLRTLTDYVWYYPRIGIFFVVD